jgi:hypothetical protein
MKFHKIIAVMEAHYLQQVEQSYKKIAEAHNSELQKWAKKLETISENEVDQYGRSIKDAYEDSLGDQAYTNEQVQQILFRSYILVICMTLERQLRDLCKFLQRRHREKFSLEDIQGNGMMACLKYIKTITEIEVFKNSPDFLTLVELRNVIVHENGVVSKDKENGMRSKFKKSALEVDFHEGQVFIKESYLQGYLKIFRSLVNELSELWG